MLRFPRALWLAFALAVALPTPSLFAELYSDDQSFVLRLDHTMTTGGKGPLALYTLASGDAAERAALLSEGSFPWWTAPDLRIAFFRPLTSALFAIDHAIAGRRAWPYHVTSIAWYAAAVLAAGALARRLLSERVAAMTTLLFAIAPSHWMAASWPSARHVAIAGVFGFLAVALHVRGRTGSDRRASIASMVCAVIALLASEAGLGAVAYIGAYEVFGRDDRATIRARALAPWLALVAVYLVVYRVGGFGVRGAGGYIDPLAEPAAFFGSLPTRVGVLACSAMLGVPAELSLLTPGAAPAMAIAGVVAVIVFALLVRRALRRASAADARTVTWLLAGAALAAVPGTAGLAGDRVLFLSSFGTLAAFAVVFVHGGRVEGDASSALAPRIARAPFALVHMVLAAPVFVFGAVTLLTTSRAAMAAATSAEIPRRAGVHVVGIGLSDPLVGMYLGSALLLAPRPPPASVDHLTISGHDHRVRRTGARTLDIAVVGGSLLENPFERVVRAPSQPIHAGDTFVTARAVVRVLADDGARPTSFSVTFDRDLDDDSLAFVVWQGGGVRAFTPPAIGDEVLIRHEVGPMGM